MKFHYLVALFLRLTQTNHLQVSLGYAVTVEWLPTTQKKKKRIPPLPQVCRLQHSVAINDLL